ncbi:hypothetical protein GOP47_0030328 [Adiantum capillus-veneris]|nr:hypothetical protein GOP47_0030328 [Adiantum capillus-veneris]
MAATCQARRSKPSGSSPVIPFRNGKPPSYPSSTEPAARWVSKEPILKKPPYSSGLDDGDNIEQRVAWDWQAREWAPDDPPINQLAKADPLSDADAKQLIIGNGKSAIVVRQPVLKIGRQGGWVSELDSNLIKDGGAGRVKRNPPTVRGGRRKGFYVTDLQGRRKPSQRDLLLLRKEKNTRRRPVDKASFLRDRELTPRRHSFLIDEVPYASYMRSPKTMLSNHKLGFVSDGPLNHYANVSAKKQAEMLLKTYGSAVEAECDDDSDDTESFHSERSACGMPWHWPGSQRLRQDAQTDSGGGCFRVPKRTVRRNRLGHKFSSKRSVSSFDSDSESAPLMTDPEHFHEYSEEFAASSVELSSETPHLANVGEYQFKRYGTLDSGYCMSGDHEDVRSRKPSVARKHRSLSQKYRPKLIKDLIGQAMVMEALSNAILRDKIAPVYLFYGPRGTGKTTAAKIFTCAMNCLSIEELRPCGLCTECASFNAGQSHDIKEVDAAGNNDVESMRLLLSNISQAPTRSRYKVFIVDDCHTLNAEAWNALLKSLEEPPSFVVFILITTDLEMLPRTAISRCQKFMFVRIRESDIVHRLRKLAFLEKIDIDIEALQFIANRSDGSFREAENLLDQLSLLGNRVTLAVVQEMVGLISDEKLAKLLEWALSADTVNTVNTIRELMETGVEPLALTSQLAVLITDILAGKKSVLGSTTMRVREEQQLRLKQVLKILSDAEKQLRFCSDRTTWLTAAFLQFSPNEPCMLPSSSRGTSVVPSPMTLFDTSEKETLDPKSWGGDERWDPSLPLQPEVAPSSLRGGPCRIEVVSQRQCDTNNNHDSGTFFQDCEMSVPAADRLREKIHRESSTASPCTMDSIWKKVVQGIHSSMPRQLLQEEGKLISIAVSEAYSIARLEFQHPEHKSMAERVRTSIAHSFQMALGCPVELEFSLCSLSDKDKLVSRENTSYVQRNLDIQNRHRNLVDQELEDTMRGKDGSFRDSSSSSRNMASAIASPLWQNLNRRRPRHGFEAERRAGSKGAIDVFSKDLELLERRRSKEGATWAIKPHDQDVIDTITGERSRGLIKHAQGRSVHEDNDRAGKGMDQGAVPSNMPETDIMHGGEYSSDSGVSLDRDDPGALCWKGSRISDSKGRHQLHLTTCKASWRHFLFSYKDNQQLPWCLADVSGCSVQSLYNIIGVEYASSFETRFEHFALSVSLVNLRILLKVIQGVGCVLNVQRVK